MKKQLIPEEKQKRINLLTLWFNKNRNNLNTTVYRVKDYSITNYDSEGCSIGDVEIEFERDSRFPLVTKCYMKRSVFKNIVEHDSDGVVFFQEFDDDDKEREFL